MGCHRNMEFCNQILFEHTTKRSNKPSTACQNLLHIINVHNSIDNYRENSCDKIEYGENFPIALDKTISFNCHHNIRSYDNHLINA